MFVERRKNKRIRVREKSIALLTPRWPHTTTVGDILDISKGGLALRCVADSTSLGMACELGIACTTPPFYLGKLPVKIILRLANTEARLVSAVPRRLGLQFGELSNHQIYQLEFFVLNHGTGEEHMTHHESIQVQTRVP